MKERLRRGLVRMMAAGLQAQSRRYPFPRGTALVVAPHADDETLGCGGLLSAKARRGDRVEVAFLSDSAGAAGEGSAADRSRRAARRRAEALAAGQELGLVAAAMHFLDAPDGRLDRLEPPEAQRVQQQLVALLQRLRPDEIFVPFLGGGSTDHDAAVWIVRDAIAAAGPRRPAVWEYPVWAWWNPLRLRRQLLRRDENFRIDLGPLRDVKRAALARHRSQFEAGAGFALPEAVVEACTGPVEFFFRRPG